jgi:hypothetical protein
MKKACRAAPGCRHLIQYFEQLSWKAHPKARAESLDSGAGRQGRLPQRLFEGLLAGKHGKQIGIRMAPHVFANDVVQAVLANRAR